MQTNAIVNSGIIITLAIIEIMFKVWKKYELTKIIDTEVPTLMDTASTIPLGTTFFNFSSHFCIVGVNITIPATQEKLSKNPTSKMLKGFISNMMMPDKANEFNES